MAKTFEISTMNIKRVIAVKLEVGEDLITVIERVAKENNIKTGFFFAVGATTKARYGIYNAAKRAYEPHEREGFFEITSVLGNIAAIVDKEGRDTGEVFVHAHIAMADHEGRVFGGHLLPGGTAIFGLGEAVIFEVDKTITRLKEEIEDRGYSPWRLPKETS